LEKYAQTTAEQYAQACFDAEVRKPLLEHLAHLSPEQRKAQGITPQMIAMFKEATLKDMDQLRKFMETLEQEAWSRGPAAAESE
jgi:hypothetical protein